MPLFHRHTHNRGCQLWWLPLYVSNAGLEDFETCEQVFTQSNALASSTQHASAFHRYQAIEEYFAFWDEAKYMNLGMLLCYASVSFTLFEPLMPSNSQILTWQLQAIT